MRLHCCGNSWSAMDRANFHSFNSLRSDFGESCHERLEVVNHQKLLHHGSFQGNQHLYKEICMRGSQQPTKLRCTTPCSYNNPYLPGFPNFHGFVRLYDRNKNLPKTHPSLAKSFSQSGHNAPEVYLTIQPDTSSHHYQ